MIDIIEKARKEEFEYCKNNIEYFIETYVHIEDKDNPVNIIQRFILWDKQKEALKVISENKLNIILKARQLGITWLVLAYAAHKMLFKKGYTVIALSRTEKEACELIRRLGVIFRNMPEFLREDIKENADWKGIKFKENSLDLKIKFPTGEESTFTAFASAGGAGRSFTANLLILDEWAFQANAGAIWLSVYPTINRPTGGQVIGLSTIERGTLFEELYTTPNNFKKIFLPWDTDPRRTKEWYESTKKDLGDKIMQEYPATVEEALTIPGGAYFPEFKEKIHVVKPVPRTNYYYKYVSIDYGLDMFAALFYEVDTRGNERIYKEIYESNLIVSEAVKRLKEVRGNDVIEYYFAPPDLWNRNRDTGKSTYEIFAENDIYLYKTSNAREQGCMNIKEHLKVYDARNEQTGETYETAKLLIEEGAAPNLVRCLKKIQKDKRRPNEYANDPHELTHIVDSLRAFCSGRPLTSAEPEKNQSYLPYALQTDDEYDDEEEESLW